MRIEEAGELLCALDEAIDAAECDGRIRVNRRDPRERELNAALRRMDAPIFVLPPVEQPPMTAALVMDFRTVERLSAALRCYGSGLERGGYYAGVPIKVDENAAGRIYIASLCPMTEAR